MVKKGCEESILFVIKSRFLIKNLEKEITVGKGI